MNSWYAYDSTGLAPGWYALRVGSDNAICEVSDPDNRHSLAVIMCQDMRGSHVAWWNGAAWEEMESVE